MSMERNSVHKGARPGAVNTSPHLTTRLALRCAAAGILFSVQAGLAGAVTFSVEPIFPEPRIGNVAIALDVNGAPHLVYGRSPDTNGDIQHVFKLAGSWHHEFIDDARISVSPAIVLSHDTTYVAYRDAAAHTARMATRIGGTWSSQLADAFFPDEGSYMSLAKDLEG